MDLTTRLRETRKTEERNRVLWIFYNSFQNAKDERNTSNNANWPFIRTYLMPTVEPCTAMDWLWFPNWLMLTLML